MIRFLTKDVKIETNEEIFELIAKKLEYQQKKAQVRSDHPGTSLFERKMFQI